MSNPPSESKPRSDADAEAVIRAIGRRMRILRQARGLTLQTVAARTGLSPSLLSMAERGRTGPSIGTLVAVASALGVTMVDLMAIDVVSTDPVTRVEVQPTHATKDGVIRRIAKSDSIRGFELAVNEFEPGTASVATASHHDGFEYGLVIEGELTVELVGTEHTLGPGDAISYPSTAPHRLRNDSEKPVKAVWLNFRGS